MYRRRVTTITSVVTPWPGDVVEPMSKIASSGPTMAYSKQRPPTFASSVYLTRVTRVRDNLVRRSTSAATAVTYCRRYPVGDGASEFPPHAGCAERIVLRKHFTRHRRRARLLLIVPGIRDADNYRSPA